MVQRNTKGTLNASVKPRNIKRACTRAPKRCAGLDVYLFVSEVSDAHPLCTKKGESGAPAPRNNYTLPAMNNSIPPTGKYQTWVGGRSSHSSGPGWPRSRKDATGANNTPLGTPARRSPIEPSPVPAPNSAAANGVKKEASTQEVTSAVVQSTSLKAHEKKRKVAPTSGEDVN